MTPPAHSPARRFSHEAMATVFEVHCEHDDAVYAAQAARAAFDVVDRLENQLSRFVPNSDVARINELRAGQRTQVSAATLECLLIARHVSALTGNAFDASIGTGGASLDLDPEGLVIMATRDGVRIDLGAIGKGYAVDRMADALEEWGITRALLHGGFSSVLALDPPAGSDGWAVTFSDPADPAVVAARLSVEQAALGASGIRKGDHIRDPRTGAPARGRRAAWAMVPRPMPSPEAPALAAEPTLSPTAIADALATAFMLMPVEEIVALCARSPGLEAWLLPATGELSAPGLQHLGSREGPMADRAPAADLRVYSDAEKRPGK